MKKLAISLLVISLLTSLSGCSKFVSNTTPASNKSNYNQSGSSTSQEMQAFYGKWTIKSPLAYGQSFELGSQDIKQLIGKKLYYGADSASFEGNVLKNPYYQLQDISEQDFFTYNYVSFKQLRMSSKSIVAINIYTTKDLNNTWTGPASQTFIKDQNTLIMIIGGVYFELVRTS